MGSYHVDKRLLTTVGWRGRCDRALQRGRRCTGKTLSLHTPLKTQYFLLPGLASDWLALFFFNRKTQTRIHESRIHKINPAFYTHSWSGGCTHRLALTHSQINYCVTSNTASHKQRQTEILLLIHSCHHTHSRNHPLIQFYCVWHSSIGSDNWWCFMSFLHNCDSLVTSCIIQ